MRRYLLIALAGTCLAATGMTCPPPDDGPPGPAALRGFSSSAELRTFLADQAKAQQSGDGWSFFGGGLLPAPLAAPQADFAAAEDTDGGAGGDPFSTTNIQEVGVDESDVVKNDGQTIYVLDGDTIHIVQATPAESVTELASLDIASSGDSLYLYGTKLVALSQQYTYWLAEDDATSVLSGEWNDGGETTVTVIDVSAPANPTVEATVRFEGSLATSRMIDSRLHLVLTSYPRLPDTPIPFTIGLMTLDQWLPDYELVGSDGTARTGDIVGWEDFYRPEEPDGYGITTVVTLDVDNPTAEFESTAITADASVIYASTKALYVTDSSYDWFSFLSREDTDVHKLALSETGTSYVASGTVPGRPLNQYSLGEHNDYLRIATTSNQFGGFGISGPTNNVYVLGVSGADLQTVGKVENIAPGETIYAARFLGDRGFLVTFEKVDPLFTLDLSEPTNPLILGELKVPGYSDHIQLMDENHLLTIGKDAQDMGSFAWFQGLQLSIFDVTDMANPTLLHKEIIGARGTDSEANHNPKAFNYFPARNALAFPIDLYSGNTSGSQYGVHTFNGLYVYRVTVENGFEFLGGISATEDSADLDCYWWGYWDFTRGIFIGDNVYSATEQGVKAAALSDVSTLIGQVQFPGTDTSDCWYGDDLIDMIPIGGGIQ